MEEAQIWVKGELPAFMGEDPIGWIARAEKFFEVQEICSFHKLQYAFMSMESVAMHWFYIWSQKNPDLEWESFSTALIKRFGDSYGSHVVESLTTLKQEDQTETETCIKERKTSTVFLKERTSNESDLKQMLQQLAKNQEIKQELDGSLKKVFVREAANSHGLQHHSCKASISELKHMLRKILNEEVDPQPTEQDKNSMEGSGSDCSEAEASSWTRKVELPTFDGSTKRGTILKGSNFECDGDPLQFLKSENRSKEGSVIKNHALDGGEETKNEAKLARETKIEMVMMEEEVDPSLKREKHKENRVKNGGCEDDFLDNPITKLIKKEVGGGDATKPHCFQNIDYHKKIVTRKQKSLLAPDLIMKLVGTSIALESWNFNLLGEPLALNFVASVDDSSAMKPTQKEYTVAVMVIQVIRSPPSSPPPPKPPDLSFMQWPVGFTIDPPGRGTKEAHPVRVNNSVLKDEKEEGEVLEFYKVSPTFYIVGQAQMGCRNGIHKRGAETWSSTWVAGFILLNLDACVAEDMLREQRWKKIAASPMEDYSEFAFIPTSTGATKLNFACRGSGSFLAKLQLVQLSSSNWGKLEEVCHFNV